MEYVYSSPAKRRKISHAYDDQQQVLLNLTDAAFVDHFDTGTRKKLLVVDINGLLVDIVADPDGSCKPDTVIASKAVFKRPFCDEFLKFCFERFSVGVWTSRTRKNLNRVLDFLMGDTQRQLLFCWDQSHCTETGFNTIENSGKPLLLKELKKLWEKQDPNLPWDRGVYDESNTVLLDDSPYKALRNPPYTAIFPNTYSYRNAQDNGLGPNGDLRNYLERLAASDNVQKFIEQNPFGQQPITHDNESWNFYHKIICSTQPGAGPSRSRKKLIVIDIDGLLVDVSCPREGFRADTVLGSRSVFKRPYCDEFLRFCFKRFNIGVWTTTPRYYMKLALDFLMRDTQHKLLFCWDLAHCIDTGFRTVENTDKKLLLKELRKLWEKKDPELPWEIGEYDESNTLLVDNFSHRALLNPPHTAIFPYPYHHWRTEDNFLGPKGDLRIYLERLAASENVQKFVSENSIGQRPIREKNLSWGFYQKVIRIFSYKQKAGDSVDARCKNSSEPKPDTAIAFVTKTLSEPKAVSSTALAAPTLLEPEPNPTTTTTTTSAADTLVEQETGTPTDLFAPTLLEPKLNSSTTLDAHTLAEPEIGTTTDFVVQVLSEPDLDTITLAAQTSLEQETVTTTVLTAHTLVGPETSFSTALEGQTLSELDPDTNALAAHTSLELETTSTAIFTVPTLLEPEIGTTTALAGQTLSKVDLGSTAQTSLESETITTMLTPPTVLEPEPGAAISLVGQTLSEPEIHTAALVAQTFIEPKTFDVDNVAVGAALQDSPPVEHKIIITQTSGAEDGKSYQLRKRERPPNSVGLKESNSALDGSVPRSRNKRVVNSVEDNSRGKRFQSSAGSKENPKVIVLALRRSNDTHRDSPLVEHHDVIITQTGEAGDGKSCQKRKRGRQPKSVGLKQTGEAEDDESHQKRTRGRAPKLVGLKKTSGADDGKSCQKRRGRSPKLVVNKPTGALKDGHGITTDLEEQPLSVLCEHLRLRSVLKRSSGHSLPAIVTTAGTTTDYQQDWPFIKLCPIWAATESLMLHPTSPQKPHFSPLKTMNELYREGFAIAHIVTYWKLFQMLSDLKPDDPVDIINKSFEVLVDLETHGFDVDSIRGRLNELLDLKSKASQHEDTFKVLEKRKYEKLEIKKDMDRLKVEMQKLQEKLVHAETMQNEEEIIRLQSNLHPVSTQIKD